MLEQGDNMNKSEAGRTLLWPEVQPASTYISKGIALISVLRGAHLCLTSR